MLSKVGFVPNTQLFLAPSHPRCSCLCVARVDISANKDPSPRAARVQLSPANHWTNPERLLITKRDEGLYTIDRSYNFLKYIDVGSRCTVIVSPSTPGTTSKLLLYSPSPITDVLKDKLQELGDVTVILAPNNEHVDFVASAAAAFPNATVLGPLGCITRWPHLPFTADTFDDGVPHPSLRAFSDVITLHFVPSVSFFNETVLVHHPSRTLVVCDLWWNWPVGGEAQRRGVYISVPTLAFAFGMNRIFAPFYNRVMVGDRRAFSKFYKKLLAERFERIVPCHGFPVEESGPTVLDSFFPGFLREV